MTPVINNKQVLTINPTTKNEYYDYTNWINLHSISVHFIGSGVPDDKTMRFVSNLTEIIPEFKFPKGTFISVDTQNKIIKFENKNQGTEVSLFNAYTDISISDNGILSLPDSSFFIHDYTFEVD